jgi:hypothetical protein
MKEGIKLDEEIKVYFMQFRVEDRVHGQVPQVCFFLSLFFGNFSPCERSVTTVLSLGSVCVSNFVLYITVLRIRNSKFLGLPDPDPLVFGVLRIFIDPWYSFLFNKQTNKRIH